MVSIQKLHGKCKILSLEQRMRKQLLWLMFILSKEVDLIKPSARVTRNASKIVFKIPTKITPKYEKSSFYMGTKRWDDLSSDIQRANSIYDFKREIDKQYRNYKDLLKLYG